MANQHVTVTWLYDFLDFFCTWNLTAQRGFITLHFHSSHEAAEKHIADFHQKVSKFQYHYLETCESTPRGWGA